MPYKIIKKGARYLLCKENVDGEVEKVLADRPTRKKAQAQMRAVYANETKARGANYQDKQKFKDEGDHEYR